MDKIIKVTPEAAEKLARRAARHVDTGAIAEKVRSMIPVPRDGRDLLLTEAIRADIINSVSMLIPKPRPGESGKDGKDGKDYVLTARDRADIAEMINAPTPDIDAITDDITRRAAFITEERFRRALQGLQRQIKSRPKPMNAGISGGDMIEEINKILGTGWQESASLITVVQKPGSTTLILSDRFKVAEFANGVSNYTYAFPSGFAEPIPVGSWGEVRKTGSGDITLAAGSGASFRSELGDVDLKLSGADGFSAFWEKTDTNVFLISGGVLAA